MRSTLLSALVLLVAAAMATPAHAEEPVEAENPLRVAVKHAPPFVFVGQGEEPHGFSIDLMQLLAAELEPPRELEFVTSPDLGSHLDLVARGEADLGIAATTVTRERERRVDFTHPFFQSSLAVAVPKGEEDGFFESLWESGAPKILLVLVIFVVVAAHLMWLIERPRTGSGWATGVGRAIWWTIVTMSTVGYGDFVPKRAASRALAVLVILVGITLFGIVVATLTASLTVKKLETDVQSLDELRGNAVAVVDDSAAQDFLRGHGVRIVTVPDVRAGFEAVRSRRSAGFLHDRPMLGYWVNQGEVGVSLLERRYAPNAYAITLPLDSKLRKVLNVALLELQEGDPSPYEQLRHRWFGAE